MAPVIDRCRAPKERRLLEKSQTMIEKELDLQKIIHRIRLLVFSTMGTLTAQQSIFADKFSQVVVHESDTDETTSSDDELSEMKQQQTVIVAAKHMMRSGGKTDKRFIDVFKVGKVF